MEAREEYLLNLLGEENVQYVVPIFQRVYSWTEYQCKELMRDALRAGVRSTPHFSGCFLYSIEPEGWDGCQRYQIVDGQQRTTTVVLALAALAKVLQEQGRTVIDSFGKALSCDDIRARFLLAGATQTASKLRLTSIDKDMLEYMLGIADKPEDISARLQENFDLMYDKLAGEGFDLNAFWCGLNLLQVVAIVLTGEDSPQLVFASLNSKGKQLNVEELLRNAILMDSAQTGQEEAQRLYTEYWEPYEASLAAVDSVPYVTINDMLCAWLASKHTFLHLTSKSEVFGVLKDDLEDEYHGSFEHLLKDLTEYSQPLIESSALRSDALAEANRWLSGKPKNSISELKMFGTA